MKLVTFQSQEALQYFNTNGVLICEEKWIEKDYGSLNYVRANGKRKNWMEEYYRLLK